MVRARIELIFFATGLACLMLAGPAFAQQGQVLTELENQVSSAAKGWETTIMDAARSLFWILAGIEVGIARCGSPFSRHPSTAGSQSLCGG